MTILGCFRFRLTRLKLAFNYCLLFHFDLLTVYKGVLADA